MLLWAVAEGPEPCRCGPFLSCEEMVGGNCDCVSGGRIEEFMVD